ncbi:hypothetical protein BC832DRAFT_169668 [Gaertneriomyces semiglobifer]|nr:hypothetical protein BC832DRAFT_169668 [Gaertneriomyces semiglobifer]
MNMPAPGRSRRVLAFLFAKGSKGRKMASTYTRPALLFGAGAVAGGLTAVAVLKWKHASAQEPAVAQSAPTAPGRTEARPAVPISPKPAKPETSPNVPNGRTKDIMKFGFPGMLTSGSVLFVV